MRSLPFTIENLNGGFMKVEGILRVEEENLVFEYQKKDAVVEAYQSELRTETISISELDMLEFKKGWFSGYMAKPPGHLGICPARISPKGC